MSRKVLLSAALIVFFAPALLAQGVTVCVFQGRESHDVASQYASDIQNVVSALSGKTLSGGAAIQAIAVPGVEPKQEDAAAQSHQCGYIISLRREVILAAPAGVAGNMSSGGVGGGHVNESAMGQGNDARLDYTLRKTGSKKKLLNGESDSSSPWDHIAGDVVKKLAREEK
jgi:hypothetical protein